MTANASSDMDVAYVARLARLDLSDEEAAVFQQDLDAVLEHVRHLEDIDVSGVEPMAHAVKIQNVTAADQACLIEDRDEVLENAPALLDGELIRVPVVIGDDLTGGA